MTLGKPCVCIMLRNSNDSISNPNLASTHSNTRSAILATSSIAAASFGHSTSVIRRVFDVQTVIGPVGSVRPWFVYTRTRDRMSVLFPTPGGPTTATTGGGPSSTRAARLSLSGTYSFFCARSRLRWIERWVRTVFATPKARTLCRSFWLPSRLSFLAFFFSRAPRPDLTVLWPRLTWPSTAASAILFARRLLLLSCASIGLSRQPNSKVNLVRRPANRR